MLKILLSSILSNIACLIFSQANYSEVSSTMGFNAQFGTGYLGGGISFCDFNGDGLDDLSVCTSQGMPLQFFQNDGSGYVDITSSIVDDTSHIKCINWVDIDNDGDKDLYLSANQGLSKLYRNDGGLNMTDITGSSGIEVDTLEAYGSSWGDIDNDGFLDLFVAIRDLNDICRFYHNNGDNTFTDITVSAGVADTTDLAFCSIFFDYDNDGDQDLYVAMDKYISQNKLYQNDGTGMFTDVSTGSGAGVWIDAMCATIGDYNNDGFFDIYVTNTPAGNEFFENNTDGTFTNIAPSNGTDFLGVGWGSQFLDADNDLDLDLYVSAMPYFSTTMTSTLYDNDGTGNYTAPVIPGMSMDTIVSFANAIGDINNDGFPDIVTNNGDSENCFLFQNEGNSNNWLKINLEGRISNRDAIGSKIKVSVNGINYYNYTNCGESYLSQNSSSEFFAMGPYTIADSVIVLWPSGHIDTLYNISANQSINIIEGQTVPIDNSIIASQSFICQGDSVTISAGDGSNDCLWSNGDTNQSIYATGGLYWATISNQFGYTLNTDTIEVVLSDIVFDFVSVNTNCLGDSSGSIILNLIGNGPLNILWNNGETTNNISNLSSSWYSASVTDINACIVQDSTFIDQPTGFSFTTGATNETILGFDGSAWVNVSGGTPPYNYFWNDPNSQTNDSITGLTSGIFIVWIIDANSCQDSLHVAVGAFLNVNNENPINEISIYPNPAQDYIKINSSDSIEEIQIFNMLGELVYQQGSVKDKLDLSHLESGSYFIQFKSENYHIQIVPLIIQ